MIDSSPDRSVAGGCPEFTEEFKKVLAAHGSKNKFRAISYETFPFGRRGPQDVPLDHEDRVLARARQLQIVSPGLASWDILSRPWRDCSWLSNLLRTGVLGYFQPSLRDSIWKE
jgi:hypothetical protein